MTSKRNVSILVLGALLACGSTLLPGATTPATTQTVNFTVEQQIALLRTRQAQQHPRWKDLSWSLRARVAAKFLVHSLHLKSTASAAAPVAANFQGNQGIVADSGDSLVLQRQSNCSLSLYTANLVLGTSPSV